MASDNFVFFDGVALGGNITKYGAESPTGESLDEKHKGWLEIKTFEFGCENPTTIGSATGGAGAGKFKLNPFKITKDVDMASSALFMACAAGAHYPTVFLSIRKAGGAQKDYLTYVFRMVFVTNVSWSGGGGEEAPEESVEFVYGAMGLAYTPQDSTGQPMADKRCMATWSQLLNENTLDITRNESYAFTGEPSSQTRS
jgi:type VI secretion system Hcp family effector